MLLTHLSHYEVKDNGGNASHKILNGSKSGCLKVAFSHGLEVVSRTDSEIELTNDCTMFARKDGSWDMFLSRKVWANN